VLVIRFATRELINDGRPESRQGKTGIFLRWLKLSEKDELVY